MSSRHPSSSPERTGVACAWPTRCDTFETAPAAVSKDGNRTIAVLVYRQLTYNRLLSARFVARPIRGCAPDPSGGSNADLLLPNVALCTQVPRRSARARPDGRPRGRERKIKRLNTRH